MFTNWLTGTSGTAATNTSNNHTNANANEQLTANNNMTTNLLSTPPDVILEVGPTPDTVRFMAHSMILGMHSGYLRSAVRLDEPATLMANNVIAASSASNATANNMLIYVANVTAEQFAPLLSYMYTGYLDLNVENIFGILLATHVLHMPRALEICRAFLARPQSDGYFGNTLNTNSLPHANLNASNASKIIRPIPSKATLPTYAFQPISTQISQQLALQLNSFKCLPQPLQQQQQQPHTSFNNSPNPNPNVTDTNVHENTSTTESQMGEEIDVDRSSSRSSSIKDIQKPNEKVLEEDEEVFIDSNTTTDVDEFEVITMKSPVPKTSVKVLPNVKKPIVKTRRTKNKHKEKCKKHTTKSVVSTLGLQVAKAPIPASQLEPTEGTKVIIDVASCDGPVRFRRILNTAYGHKPDAYVVAPERSQQSVSLSFHQQMARTIRQQAEESENKDGQLKSKQNSSEIYVCVYCKHTFKSQYCYQKHAKRHLNPLSLSCARSSGGTEGIDSLQEDQANTTSSTIIEATITKVSNSKVGIAAAELLRREVRPLDMNVQYYPCKTCGSKFPSYYFVHKHRKLCHADEEANNSLDASDKNSTNHSDDASKKSI